MTVKTVWETLSKIDVNGHTETKNGFTYLSWAWAWGMLKEHYPTCTKEVYTSPATELPFVTDPSTGNAFVQVTVTAGDQSYTENYPVLDYANKPIANPNAFQVNTSIQRCTAKAIAMLGLGHYIYAGEDLPPMDKVAVVEGNEARGEDNEEIKTEATGIEMIAETFEKFLPFQTTLGNLEEFWKKNKKAIDILKRESPTRYQEVLASFKMRRAVIEKNGGKAVNE